MAHFVSDRQPTSLVDVSVGVQIDVQLWGEGPNGQRLEVDSTNPDVVRVEEVQASVEPRLRSFWVRGIRQGSARLHARIGPGGSIWADTRVIVGRKAYNRYYHGTDSATADRLVGDDLTPKLLSVLVTSFDWTDYTDFGKGFYVHLEENKALAYKRAKEKFSTDWAVVEFIATQSEIRDLEPNALLFLNKSHRPHNSPRQITIKATRNLAVCPVPQSLPCLRMTAGSTGSSKGKSTMSWLEFVEYNRHIEPGGALIARENDRDWTHSYSSMRGPLWVPRDSGYDSGRPVFPDDLHQLCWGRNGLAMLNSADAKLRRFKFSAQNEGLFPAPA